MRATLLLLVFLCGCFGSAPLPSDEDGDDAGAGGGAGQGAHVGHHGDYREDGAIADLEPGADADAGLGDAAVGDDGAAAEDGDASVVGAGDAGTNVPDVGDDAGTHVDVDAGVGTPAGCAAGSECGESTFYRGTFYCFAIAGTAGCAPGASKSPSTGLCLPQKCSADRACAAGSSCVEALTHPGDFWCRPIVSAIDECAPGSELRDGNAGESVCYPVSC